MDLNKDNRNIYTVDAESYSEYMHENWKKPTSFLNSVIKILLFILLLVVAYFFYKIVKADLSFSEVFNKKELLATYTLFNNDDKIQEIEKEDYVEVLAKNIPTDLEEPKKVVLSVTKKYDEPVAPKKEEVTIEKVVTVVVPEVTLEEPPSLVENEVKITKIEPVELEVQEEVEVVNDVVEVPTIEVVTTKEEPKSTVVSETYLDRMVEELNSI